MLEIINTRSDLNNSSDSLVFRAGSVWNMKSCTRVRMREVLVNYLEQPKAHQKFNQDIFLYDCAGTTMCRNGGFNSVKWNPWVFTSQLCIPGSGWGVERGGKCILFSHLSSSPSSYRKLPLAAVMHISKVDFNSLPWQISSLNFGSAAGGGRLGPEQNVASAFQGCNHSPLVDNVKYKPGCRSAPLLSHLWYCY